MKIDPAGPVGTRPTQRRHKTTSSRAGAFAKHVPGESASPAPVSGATPVSAVDALLSLQEVEDSTSEQAKDRAWARGEMLLDRLDEIRHGLLDGRLSRDTLDRLSQAVHAERIHTSDPRLAQVLDEIELRAEVELAKLDHVS